MLYLCHLSVITHTSFSTIHTPPKEDINDRIYKCQSALAHAMLGNLCPHFIYGTKNCPPICLPVPIVDDPMKVSYNMEQDSTIIAKYGRKVLFI